MANLHPNQLARSGHIVVGVDTHKHVQVAAVMDTIAGIQATITVATDAGGSPRCWTGPNLLVRSSRSASKAPAPTEPV